MREKERAGADWEEFGSGGYSHRATMAAAPGHRAELYVETNDVEGGWRPRLGHAGEELVFAEMKDRGEQVDRLNMEIDRLNEIRRSVARGIGELAKSLKEES